MGLLPGQRSRLASVGLKGKGPQGAVGPGRPSNVSLAANAG
jgi:hypothetical protein